MSSTIAGIATAQGEGGIAIVRISGDKAVALFEKVFVSPQKKSPYQDHLLMYGHLMDGSEAVDEVMGVVMLAPHTYTREDVCELHTHGGYLAAAKAMKLLISLGAEPAQPGEFTRRAFVNGRIDLMQAEAVMGVIASRSEAALRSEERLLRGGQSAFIREAQEKLCALLAGLEAHIDYPDEIPLEEAEEGLETGLNSLCAKLERAVDIHSARLIREGLHVAVFGRPNAGKSTLFNALLGEDKAIVTPVPGTTRDVLEGSFPLEGFIVHLQDTAGLRETSDMVERIGVERARQSVSMADAGLLMIDASSPLIEEDIALFRQELPKNCAVLLNKQDRETCVTVEDIHSLTQIRDIFPISAKEQKGLGAVREYLKGLLKLSGEELLTHERHMSIVREVIDRLHQAQRILQGNEPVDLVAIDLHEALYLLGRVTGESVDEALLDDIFSRFCVGK